MVIFIIIWVNKYSSYFPFNLSYYFEIFENFLKIWNNVLLNTCQVWSSWSAKSSVPKSKIRASMLTFWRQCAAVITNISLIIVPLQWFFNLFESNFAMLTIHGHCETSYYNSVVKCKPGSPRNYFTYQSLVIELLVYLPLKYRQRSLQ